ncbi:MAG: hypothetical protein ACRDQA_12950 [Nocardioidaceae bacterium]
MAERIDALGGTVQLIGTRAEEGGAGKEHIARAGGLEGTDATVMLHPFSYDVATHPFLGRRIVDVAFYGTAAHTAAIPFMGRNALDAAVAAYNGVASLRQHLPLTDRVHGVFTDGGGERPNVVSARTALRFYARSADPSTLMQLSGRIDDIFTGAALITGTRTDISWHAVRAYLPIRHNRTLAARWATHMEGRGGRVLGRRGYPKHAHRLERPGQRKPSGAGDPPHVGRRAPARIAAHRGVRTIRG